MTPKQFKDALDQLHLRQVEFASLIGVDGRTVRHYIAGDRKIPTTTELILKALLNGTLTRRQLEALGKE
jgi:plasmid maintenance system antidote protein VapI